MLTLPLDTIIHGDALEALRQFPENSVDALCTDPPAGIHFMGRAFDSDRGGRTQWVAWLTEIMRECLRVLKPGGHGLVWALPRTSHWTAWALEDAGFEIRDCFYHIFGSGFPKSLDISKAIDKMAGAKRETVGFADRKNGSTGFVSGGRVPSISNPATVEAQQWQGWGTGLKPSVECWWLIRKPLGEKNVASNVLEWGTGGINVGVTRVAGSSWGACSPRTPNKIFGQGNGTNLTESMSNRDGRWPSHLLLTHSLFCSEGLCDEGCPVRILNEQSGIRNTHAKGPKYEQAYYANGATGTKDTASVYGYFKGGSKPVNESSKGGASRFFAQFYYAPKASRNERSRGLEGMSNLSSSRNGKMKGTPEHRAKKDTPEHNNHPTVKSQQLMRYLVRLITPPGGIVLDCFAGSGSTLLAAIHEQMHFIGIEQSDTQEEPYVSIARARIAQAYRDVEGQRE